MHSGVIVVVNTVLGLATPPYGLLLFVVSGITWTPIMRMIRNFAPFLAIMIFGLAIITRSRHRAVAAAALRLRELKQWRRHLTETTIDIPAETDAQSEAIRPVLAINGPNLNMLGTRQPEVYGHDTLADVERLCRETAAAHGLEVDFRQSDSEAEIIRWIQEARMQARAIFINHAGFTSTSIAILDALLMFEGPIFGCHISALFRREEFRHLSYVSKAATAKIEGFGIAATASPSPGLRSSSGSRPEEMETRVE